MLVQLAWVLAFLTGIPVTLAALRWAQVRFAWHPEVVRKCVHVLLGASTLAFPWVFESRWPVILLAAVSAALLWMVRVQPGLRTGMGESLGAVNRASLGEFCFPLGVALVFCLALHDPAAPPGLPVLYLIPILVLTLADALGALVGVGYGRVRYRTDDGVKSAEGSLAFLGVAFLCCHTVLLLGTELGRAETLLIALHLAVLVTIMEALSWNGLDNLFIPLGTYVLLRAFVGLQAEDLALRLAVIALLLLALALWRHRTYLQGSALLGVALALYSIWFLGGIAWFWPPAMLWLAYTRLCPSKELRLAQSHTAKAVTAVAAAPIAWLLLHDLLGRPTFLPYVASLAGHLSLITFAHLQGTGSRRTWEQLLLSGLVGFGLIGVPYLCGWLILPALESGDASATLLGLPLLVDALTRLACFLLCSFGAVLVFWLWQVRRCGLPLDAGRWWRQALVPALLSLAGSSIVA